MRNFSEIIRVGMFLIAAVLIVGCGPITPKTEVHAGQVTQGNSFSSTDNGASHKVHTSFTLTPAVGVVVPATQPATFTIEGKTVTAPPGASVVYTNDVEDHDIPGAVTEENHATSLGASISTDGDKGNVTGDAPVVTIAATNIKGLNGSGAKGGGGNSSGGTTDFSWTELVASISAASSTAKWMMLIGAILLVAGWIGCGIYSWMTDKIQWIPIAIVTAVGVAIIGTAVILDTHPIFFILAVVTGVGALVWYFYEKMNTATTPTAGTPSTPTPAPTGFISTVEADLAAVKAKLEGYFAGKPAPLPMPTAPVVSAAPPIPSSTVSPLIPATNGAK